MADKSTAMVTMQVDSVLVCVRVGESMEGRRLRGMGFWWPPPPLLLFLLLRCPGFCCSLNDEGRALLRFRERVEEDPFSALSDWVAGEDTEDACDWFGVECEGGKVAVLNLKDLYLKGTLTPEIVKLFNLRSLILHNNSFYGFIPKEFGEFEKLEVLDLGYNNLSGCIPSNLGKILSLEFLMTGGNQFLGCVPSELQDLSVHSDSEVDVKLPSPNGASITRIGGNATIRKILQQSKTTNAKHPPGDPPNNLSPPSLKASPSPNGPTSVTITLSTPPDASKLSSVPSHSSIPSVSPSNSNPTSKPVPSVPPSNSIPTPKSSPSVPPSNSTHTPEPSGSSSKKYSRTKYMVMLVGVGLGIFSLGALLVFCVHYQCNNVVNVKPWTTGLSGQLRKAFVTGVSQLKRSELETACEDFSNIIGSLSDCMLYKGTLSSGTEIAVTSTIVTSAKDWSKHSEFQFQKKIATLSKVNHKNFVNLLGYCVDEEPFTRMMVFEYAPNGTLFEHLHINEAQDLDWATRLRISMGVAYCLDHMHQLKSPVILENLQSSSIYLTDDFAAKVSDFEFWSRTMVDESDTGSSGPLEEQILNPETIVYNFGVLLLEIITGRPPYSEDSGLLLQWASDYLNGSKSLRGMVDPNLKSFREDDVSAICMVIRHCCNPVSQARPMMREVVSRLREITAVPPDGASPKLSPLWWAELEILSTDAN